MWSNWEVTSRHCDTVTASFFLDAWEVCLAPGGLELGVAVSRLGVIRGDSAAAVAGGQVRRHILAEIVASIHSPRATGHEPTLCEVTRVTIDGTDYKYSFKFEFAD